MVFFFGVIRLGEGCFVDRDGGSGLLMVSAEDREFINTGVWVLGESRDLS